MIQLLIYRIFRRRHYWRGISFDEVAELYTSRLLTVFALNIVNLFAAVYLYRLGYSLVFIALFYGGLYLMRVPFAYVAARIAAYFGPKHGIFAANLIRVPSLIAFALAPDYGLVAVLVFGVLQQVSATIYDLCYMVDFSKIKSLKHAGKEIGNMQIIERIARVLSPLIGGVVAAVYGPQATIIVASLIFMVAALPLFKSIEPTKTRAKFRISGFPWRAARRSLVAQTVVGFDFVTSGLVWTLFAATVVLGALGQGIYAALGALTSLGVAASVLAAWMFGQLVDRRRGDVLLAFGAVANTIIHLFRPFTTTTTGIVATNIASEVSTSAYAMPFTRVVFDTADSSGFRITYLMFIEMMVSAGAALGALLFAVLVILFGNERGMQILFVIAAFYQLIMLLAYKHAR